MTNFKILKIIIPVVVVMVIGIFFGLIALQSDNSDPVKVESTVDFEINSTGGFSSEDPNVDNSSKVSETEVKPPRLVGEVRVTRTLPVIETLEEEEILLKTIPPNYKFGSFFDNGLLIGMGTSTLENSEQIHSIRFTNKQDGQINGVSLKLLVPSPVEIIVGIQEDDGEGHPNGIWKNEESYIKTEINTKKQILYFEFPNSFKVSKDKIYHIVLQLAQNSSENLTSEDPTHDTENGQSFTVIHYKENTPHQPFNPGDPDIYWPDPAINSLHYDGADWTILDKWPVYLLKYVNGTVDGQPYTLIANWVIQENRPVGQTIIPHSDYEVSTFAFLVSKKGNPTDSLFYGVKDLKNNLLASGEFVKSDDLTDKPSFVEVSLDNTIHLNAGELYRFYIYSPITKGDSHYNLYGHEFSFNNTAGYGGQIHRLTTSSNFETWGSWYDADAVFALTTKQ